ncbi:Trm112 family protein [bacterium]|nr:Trm112 family protein [bacterium]
MALSKQLLDMLICPNCRYEELDYDEAGQRLACSKCSFLFRVTDDVPVLLVDEAEKKE